MTNSTDLPSGIIQPTHPRLTDGGEAVSLSTAIVRKVAAAKDVAPSALPPLYEVIDSDALDRLFDSRINHQSRTSGRIEFEYCGYQVTATSTGDVQTLPIDDN
ncbi:HalOD1 output domain-containing protein [Haladaptatus sp. CMAA 1911]|uniref:HalOD1 output domain-containing protein n=1 Tax=unclassified Haladaptatus TaxID=2622732 RepID=UPI00375467B7